MAMVYDVIIVGAGAAGLMAALELTKNEKKVLLLEKGKSLGISNFARAGGPAACETNLQAKEGAPVSQNTLFSHMANWARHTVNEALLWEVLGCTGIAVNWMEELGIELELLPDTYGVGFRARHFVRSRGKKLTEPIQRAIEMQGGEIRCGCRVTEIVPEQNIFRVTARQEENNLEFSSANVLICTGGFQGSPKLIRRFFGLERMVSLGNNLSEGDGILMAEQLGAVCDRNFALPGNEGSATTSKCRGYNDNLCFGLYGGLLVDHNGRRFMNEKDIADFPLSIGGEAFARHEKTYAVIDDETFQACISEGIYKFMGEPENWRAGAALWHPVLKNAREHLQKAVEEGWAYSADSIEELASCFHVKKLAETVEQYNQMCDQGVDRQFKKPANFMRAIRKAPYYIFEYEPACWCTNGGIKTDSRLQALGADGEPIHGLYIAGVDCGSMYSVPYYDNEGASVGLALGSGIYAGKIISEEL